MSETGVATKLNYPDAIKYYQLAAKKGNANAKLALARMYQYGLGVTKDSSQSVKLYKELAAEDNAYAQYQLAMFDYDEKTAKFATSQSLQLLQTAEANGSPQARNVLQRLDSLNHEKTASFIEPVVKLPSSKGESADLMYMDALNAWNRGDELLSRIILGRILNQYPDYTPAKQANEQLGQGLKIKIEALG